jgi:Na+-transporting NADH:ubiquinone oxidoreductase subunit NqrB
MRSDVTLRLSIVILIAVFIAMLAGLYEVDRREKSNSETVRILSDQFAGQLAASERRLQFLMGQIQVLESRLKKLQDDLRVRVRPAGP